MKRQKGVFQHVLRHGLARCRMRLEKGRLIFEYRFVMSDFGGKADFAIGLFASSKPILVMVPTELAQADFCDLSATPGAMIVPASYSHRTRPPAVVTWGAHS
jgi:hypothetical protein